MTSDVLSNFKQLAGLGSKVNLVAVHSCQSLPPELIEQLYDQAVQWMNTLGVHPKTFSSFGVSGFQEAKGYPFAGADKKLRKRGFKNIASLGLSAAPPVRAICEVDPRVEFDLINSQVDWSITSIVWSWNAKYCSLDKKIIDELIKPLREVGIVDYAFAASTNSKQYPDIWSSLSAFKILKKKGYELSITSGFSEKKSFEEGRHVIDFLKEIYPFQIISIKHLGYKVGNQTLMEWINSTDKYGVLTEFCEERWLWEIPKEQLPFVRQALIENNLLTLYLPDMSRILKDYAKPMPTPNLNATP